LRSTASPGAFTNNQEGKEEKYRTSTPVVSSAWIKTTMTFGLKTNKSLTHPLTWWMRQQYRPLAIISILR